MLEQQKYETISKWICGLLICITIALSAYAHVVAGMTLPLPWNDEAAFVWPAVSVMEDGTLSSDYINTERPVMWMPPGYMLLLGIIFRVTGYSFGIARWISWFFSIVAYGAAVALLWKHPLRLITVGLCSALWLGVTYVAIGNIARMDSLTFAMALCGYLLITRKQLYMGLALLCITTLVHPNGVYFLAVAIGYSIVFYRTSWPRITKSDAAALGIAGILVIVYGVYILQNKVGFLQDMAEQFIRKGDRNPIQHILSGANIYYLGALSLVSLYLAIRRSPMLLYVGLTAACFIISGIGMEMWYELFAEYAFVMMSIGCLWCAWYFLRKSRLNIVVVYLLIGLLTCPVLLFHYRHGYILEPRNWPEKLTWGWGMKTETEISYFTKGDFDSIQRAVEDRLPIKDHTPARVTFIPNGDGLMFHNAWQERAHVYAPFFTSVPADIFVIRESRYTPPWQQEQSDNYVKSVPVDRRSLIVRDKTEKWHIYALEVSN